MPTLTNVAYLRTLFLDGRRDSLETQAAEDPLMNPLEHGLNSTEKILDIVRIDPEYRAGIQKSFNISTAATSMKQIVEAIACHERTLVFGNSPFDRFFFEGDRSALPASAVRGLNIFRRKGNCANCHEISGKPAIKQRPGYR